MDIWEELKKPFPAEEINWRVQSCGISNGRPWAMVLAYIDARAVMDRLDEVVGPENWKDDVNSLENGKTFCKLSVRVDGEWITKTGVAGETNIEGAKGGASDALKRAGVKFGIARYLYHLEEDFAECKQDKPNNWRDNGWHRAKTKNKKTIYWKEPNLPGWALPSKGKNVNGRQGQTPNQSKDRSNESKSELIDEVRSYFGSQKTHDTSKDKITEHLKKHNLKTDLKQIKKLDRGHLVELLEDIENEIEKAA